MAFQKQISEEEFKKLKELQFRGETHAEIVAQLQRSDQAVRLMEEAKDFADYKRIANLYWKSKESRREISEELGFKQKTYTHKTTTERLPVRYFRLKEMKERLDEVLADFVYEEIKQAQQQLSTQIEKLQAENLRLKEQLQAESTPDFSKKLAEKLHENSEVKANSLAE